MNIRLASGKQIPIEMHKVRIVQSIRLPSVDERLKAAEEEERGYRLEETPRQDPRLFYFREIGGKQFAVW